MGEPAPTSAVRLAWLLRAHFRLLGLFRRAAISLLLLLRAASPSPGGIAVFLLAAVMVVVIRAMVARAVPVSVIRAAAASLRLPVVTAVLFSGLLGRADGGFRGSADG